MANIMDYLDWRGDLSFSAAPFNEVDNVILCKLCSADLSGIVPPDDDPMPIRHAVKGYFAAIKDPKRLGVFFPRETLALLRRLPAARRFRDCLLSNYVNKVGTERDGQFSALTIDLGDGTSFVAFRGTDDTIVAWKENFNMSVYEEVPAQSKAKEYLCSLLMNSDRTVRAGGHSKGGNLAVYAAMNCPPELQDRIIGVYNNDGPGFFRPVKDLPGYVRIRPKVLTLVPRHCIVGLLLNHEEEYQIVKCTHRGVAAHNGFTWEVRGAGFVRCNELSAQSELFERAFQKWVMTLNEEGRRQFIDTLFAILTSTGAETLTDLNEHRLRQALKIANNLRRSPEDRKLLALSLKLLIREYVSCAREILPLPEIRLKIQPRNNGERVNTGKPTAGGRPPKT
ncbi:MAG: DUF2974 domain-containing protein [Clostridiales bacterium]|jgi:hypothetical protein|nr:DUF2974 domain-containing protein [Clostridiales bacterium]